LRHYTLDLHLLAAAGKLPIIQRLLQEAAAGEGSGRENAVDAAGETMMHRAARNGHAHVVEAGADTRQLFGST